MLEPPNVWRKRQVIPLPLLLCGKRRHQELNAASSPGESFRSRVLFIHERCSVKRFIVDSGAAVSAIPLYPQTVNGSTVASRSKLSTERALKPTASACSNSTLVFVAHFPTFLLLLVFFTPSSEQIFSKNSTFSSVFADGASLMTQLTYQ